MDAGEAHPSSSAAAVAAMATPAAPTTTPTPAVFASVVYFVNDDLKPDDRDELSAILDAGGAARAALPEDAAATPAARFDPTRTTHVIAASIDFHEYDACDDPQADSTDEPSRRRACVVSSQWVRRSWSLGTLQPERFFSADPANIFSGIVISCARLPKSDAELLSAAVLSLGGGYRDKLTREVTHLVAINRDGPKFAKLNTIYDAQQKQLTDAAASLAAAVSNRQTASADAPQAAPDGHRTGDEAGSDAAMEQISQLAKSQWNVKVVLPTWIDDSYRLYKLVDPTPYTWPLGATAHAEGKEPVYLRDRAAQAPFSTTALESTSYTDPSSAVSISLGTLHNPTAAIEAFQKVAEAGSKGKLKDGSTLPNAPSTVFDALMHLLLHAPENRGWPTYEEIAPAIKNQERLAIPVDAQGHDIATSSHATTSGPASRRGRQTAGTTPTSGAGPGSAASSSKKQASAPAPLSTFTHVLAGRAVLFGADVMMANPDRVYAYRTRIQVAGGRFVEPPEKEEEVALKVGEADIVVTKCRESKECLEALKQSKMCGTPSWLAFVLSTGRISNPRHNLLHFPIPKDPIPAFSKFTITLTNYTGESRTMLRQLINHMGGKFTPEMTSANTHCIASSEEGEKVKRAKEWGIPVLNHLWLEVCFTRWQCVDVLQQRFTEFGPAIRYGRQVLVDSRLDNEVLEPWYQRAFENDEARKARLALEAEVVAGRLPRADGNAKEKEAGLKKNGTMAPTKSLDATVTSAENAAGRQAGDDTNQEKEEAPRASWPSTRNGTMPTKRKSTADEQPTDNAPPAPEPRVTRQKKAVNGDAGHEAEDKMDVDDAVMSSPPGRGLRRSLPSASAQTAAASTTLTPKTPTPSSPTKAKVASVKKGSGSGPASKVPGRPSLPAKRKTISAGSPGEGEGEGAGAGAGVKRGREVLDEKDEEDDDDDDLPSPSRLRSSSRIKSSPDRVSTPKATKSARTSTSHSAAREATKKKPPPLKRVGDTIYFATTGVDVSEADLKLLRTLKAFKTEDIAKATHLVAAGVSRTEKMLCAIARGNVMIVDKAWLTQSVRKKQILDEANYPIQDPANERKYGVKLETSLERSRAKPGQLLRKHEFYMTRNVKPSADVLRRIILAAGGSAPAALPNVEKLEQDREHLHLISCAEDRALWKDLEEEREPVRVYEAELIIAGVLTQKMEWDKYRLL